MGLGSLSGSFLTWGDPAFRFMVTSKRVYIKRDLPRLLLPVPHSCGEPLPTHSSTGDPPTLAGILVQSSVESLLLSSESWCAQVLFVLSKTAVSASPSPMEVFNKILLASRSDSLGIPSPFVRSPGWEAWHGVLNLQDSRRTSLVLLFSSLWVTHLAGTGFDFILIVPLLPYSCNFFFVFGHAASILGRFQDPPVGGCSTVGCDFGALVGGNEHMSFYSTILNWKGQKT